MKLRLIGKGFLAVIIGTLLLFGAALAYAQTDIAKRQISGLIEDRLNDDTQQAAIEELGGFLPFDVRLGRFSLADDEGVWLQVEKVRFEMSPAALLKGAIHVRQLGAERIAVERLPDLPPGPEEEDTGLSLPTAPELPESVAAVIADRIYVDRIELGAPVLGEAATFSLDGKGGTSEGGTKLAAELTLRRIDQPTASADLRLNADLTSKVIDLKLDASETGGLMAALSGIDNAGDLSLTLDGNGPLSNWQAKLVLDAQNLVNSEIDLNLAYDDQPSIDLKGFLTPAPGALPDGLGQLIGDRLEIALSGGQRSTQEFALDHLRLESALLTLSGQARANLTSQLLEGSIEGRIDDASLASELAGVPLAGTVTLDLDASGTTAAPRFDLSLIGQNIAAGTFRADQVETNLKLALLAPLGEPFAGVDIQGSGSTTGMSLGDDAAFPEPDLKLEIAAQVPLEGQAQLSTLTLKGRYVDINATADLAMPGLGGTAALRAKVADLGRLIRAVVPDGPAIEGGVDLDLDVTIGDDLKTIDGTLSLATQSLAGLPGGVDPVVGANPGFSGRFSLAQLSNFTISDISLQTAAGTITGDVAFGLDEDAPLDGDLKLDIPSLRLAEPLVGQPIDGKLDATFTLSGTRTAPNISLEGDLEDLAIADRQFDSIRIDGSIGGPFDNLTGQAKIDARQGSDTLSLAAVYELAGDRLSLNQLELTGPQTSFKAAGDVDLASLRTTGELTGKVSDLAALQPWHGQVLEGSIDVAAEARLDGETQDASLTLNGSGIRGDFGAISTVAVAASGKDLFGKFDVTAEVTVDRFENADLLVNQATVSLSGNRDSLSVDATAEGQQNGPFALSSKARLSLFGATKQVLVDELDGTIAGQRIELVNPATLTLSDGILDLDQLDLKIGDAQIQGKLNLQDKVIRAEAAMDDFALTSLEDFGGPALLGTMKANLTVGGTMADPTIQLAALADGVRMADPAFASDPKARVEFKTDIAEGVLTTLLEVHEISAEPISIKLRLPIDLSLEPARFDIPTTAPLEASLHADTDVAPLIRLATLDGQELKGRLIADLKISGTRDSPSVEGEVRLDDGRFADSVSGVVLTGLKLMLKASGDRIELEELSARDRGNGKLTIKGSANIGLKNGYPYDVKVKSKRLIVLDNDLGRALASSDVTIGGDLQRGSVSGKITIDRADLEISSGGAVSPPDLQVRETGLSAPYRPKPRQLTSSNPYVMALNLDIVAPQEIFVRGRGLQTEWGGKVTVAGNSAAPIVSGQLDYRRGYLDFLTKRFNVTNGTIRFTGGENPIPLVEIEARAQGATLVAIVTIDGAANDPDVELTSDPSRPQDEILADVLFGSDPADLSPAQAIGLANAVAQLEGGGVDAIGKIRQMIGLDTFDVGGDNPDDPTASAGKYVGNNVFVEIERGVEAQSGKARVEIELTPSLSVGTEVLEQGQTGVGFEWSYDF